MKANASNKKQALDNFQLFYEEIPVEAKSDRLVNETRIRRKSRTSS